MEDLTRLLAKGNVNLKLEVSGEDLLSFSNELINRAKTELASATSKKKEEKYLTKEEVKAFCNVCDTTLWHWNKRGYLKVIKIGNKVRYRQSDISKILGEDDGS